MKRLYVILGALLAVGVMTVPAQAKAKVDPAKLACGSAAVIWSGEEGSTLLVESSASSKPFQQLATSNDKSLRRAIQPLLDDPTDNAAAHRFGTWCKSHYPKNDTITNSVYSVPKPHIPTAADFTITLDVISKECFGNAGCVITYKPTVNYNALSSLDPAKNYTVVYDVAGGDAPATANLTVQGTSVSYHNGVAQTPDEGATLSATVTSIFATN